MHASSNSDCSYEWFEEFDFFKREMSLFHKSNAKYFNICCRETAPYNWGLTNEVPENASN